MKSARRTTVTSAAVLAVTGGLLTTTAAPASAATTCTSPVFKRQFFANTTFSGTPKKTDCDNAIDQTWTGAPASGLPSDNFGVRWSVTRDFGSGGPFALAASGLDGIRVYVDGVRRIDLWKNTTTTVSKTVNVTVPSGKHTLRVDYVNWTGSAKVKFGYTPRTSATVDQVKPLTPTGTSVAYDAAAGKAKLTWAKNQEMDLAGYRVYRRLKGASFGSTPLTTTTATSYTDTPPPTGETYYYEVRAHDKAGNASTGTTDQGVTTVDRTGPAAPAGLSAHGDLDGMVLGWDAVPGAVGYEVFEKDAATGSYTLLKSLTGTSYLHYVGHDATPHTYVVRSLDALGNPGPYSAPVTSDGIDRTAPPAPFGLDVVTNRGDVHVSWKTPEAHTRDELDNYGRFTVYRSVGATVGADAERIDCDYLTTLHSAEGVYVFDCDDPTWAYATTYTYAVTFTDGQGNESTPSAPVTVTTADRVPPAPVTGLTATPRGDGMLLRWNASTDEDIDHYWAARGVRQADGSFKATDPCTRSTTDPLTALCIGIPDGENAAYAVYAVDKWGNASTWTVVDATELTITPGEPIGADSGALWGSGGWTIPAQSENVLWHCSGDICADITAYRVSRWNAETQAYDLLGTVAPKDGVYYQSYTDATMPLGSISYYRVVGVLSDGTETAAAHPWQIRPDLV
ncbi:fibronectin type III domain-containing protein [Streptomyces sp. NPDC057280]|uniref:fibronectin type III domain-containing protein n=1 Tax=Streptomyces sp. NPDC057280 TaxID=3346081 RepID=UPI0036317B34